MSPEPTDAKLAPDATEITTGAFQGLPKVQLDIDDAPFLREQEEEAPPPPPQDEKTGESLEIPPPPVEDKAARRKKRLVIISAAALVLLLAGGGGSLWWFVLRTPPPPPPAPQVVVVPSTPLKTGAPSDFLIPIAPFWLELPGDTSRDKNTIFFLVCKFTAIAKSEGILQEAQNKVIVIRDALYFYLKNKSYDFLTDPGSTQTIKNDLISVINGYLATGKVDDVLFERYITK